MSITIPSNLTDDELVLAIGRLRGDEREVTARLVAHLAEMEGRRLYVPMGYDSLFIYCHEGLGYSEDAAYNRKTAALVARRYPVVVDMLADGRLSLTAVRLLAPVLKEDNWQAAFAEAAGRPKREIEKLVARLEPKPDVPSTIRKLPMPVAAVPERRQEPGAPAAASVPGWRQEPGDLAVAVPEERRQEPGDLAVAVPERRQEQGQAIGEPVAEAPAPRPKHAEVKPLAPARYRVGFTIGEETEKKLRRLQQLLRREIPDGDPGVIFDRAVTLLLETVEARKLGTTAKPRRGRALEPGSRRVPAATRRQVVPRDGGQCTFVGADGRRCTARAFLEFHHAGVPFAHGGDPGRDNIALHCRAHNAFEGKRIFGPYLPKAIREARAQYDAMRFPVPERECGDPAPIGVGTPGIGIPASRAAIGVSKPGIGN